MRSIQWNQLFTAVPALAREVAAGGTLPPATKITRDMIEPHLGKLVNATDKARAQALLQSLASTPTAVGAGATVGARPSPAAIAGAAALLSPRARTGVDYTNIVDSKTVSFGEQGAEVAFNSTNTVAAISGRKDPATQTWFVHVVDVAKQRDKCDAWVEGDAIVDVDVNGDTVAISQEHGGVRLLDANTGAAKGPNLFGEVGDLIQDSTLSPDGKTLATWVYGAPSYVLLANTETGQRIGPPIVHHGGGMFPDPLRFSPDGKTIAIHKDAQTLQIIDTATGLPRFPPINDAGHDVTFSADGKTFALMPIGTRIYDTLTGTPIKLPDDVEFDAPRVVSPDGRTAVTTDGKRIRFWDVETNAMLPPTKNQTIHGTISRMAFGEDGKSLLVIHSEDNGRFQATTYHFGDPA